MTATPHMNILFVCTGNTCRSPLAEAIARKLIVERGIPGVSVQSAGTHAHPEASASDGAVLVALEEGIDLTPHRAQELTPELVQWATIVLTMGPHHLERVEALGGAANGDLLAGFASRGESARSVSDPFGGDLGVYRATFHELTQEIGNVLSRITSDRYQPPV